MSSRSESLMGRFSGTNINTFNCLQCRMERSMTRQKWPAVNRQHICCSHPLCHKAVESWATHFNLQTRLWPRLWFAARSARHHDEHSAQISFPSLCILQADNSRMRGSSQSRRRPSRTSGSSQSYLSSLSLITALWSEVSKKTLAVWLFLMQMSSQACFSHLLQGSLNFA